MYPRVASTTAEALSRYGQTSPGSLIWRLCELHFDVTPSRGACTVQTRCTGENTSPNRRLRLLGIRRSGGSDSVVRTVVTGRANDEAGTSQRTRF